MIEIRLYDQSTPLEFKTFQCDPIARQLWSDGTLDGTYITRMVGYERSKPQGKVELMGGGVIYFATCRQLENGNIVIDAPYRIDTP